MHFFRIRWKGLQKLQFSLKGFCFVRKRGLVVCMMRRAVDALIGKERYTRKSIVQYTGTSIVLINNYLA